MKIKEDSVAIAMQVSFIATFITLSVFLGSVSYMIIHLSGCSEVVTRECYGVVSGGCAGYTETKTQVCK